MADDPLIRQKEEAEVSAGQQARFADLFDVRRIIGGLLGLYGVILFVLGLFASDEDIERAADVNINLWAGVGLIVVALIFLVWAFLRPVGQQLVRDAPSTGPTEAPAPVGVDAAALPGARAASEQARRRPGGDDERPRR
jgi:hypothetical protein